MATSRVSANDLARFWNSVHAPIFVLDDELTLLFANRACLEWLGCPADGLLGTRCTYHSRDPGSAPASVAAGLCPPPQVMTGQSVSAAISCTTAAGQIRERRARFLPLTTDSDTVFCILALVETTDVSTASAVLSSSLDEPTAPTLHAEIARFRRKAAARYRADRLIGDTPALQLARRQVELAVATHDSVLLVGPPGSGRQHLAAAIHYGANESASSAALASSLIPLDCSLLGADLLEALIAAITKISAMGDAVATATMVFSRVDELSADMQTELAILLQRRTLPLRLLATAAQPLLELARRGLFRADLAAMLSTIVIELPSLSERRADLPLLAQLFLEDANAAGARQIGGFTPAALDALDAYSWPGNLDELAATVSAAHRAAAGLEIDVADLPDKLHRIAQAAAHPRKTEETIVLDEYLARVERELIRRAVARAKGNKAQAARLLGLTRPRLYRRMLQLGLEPGNH